MRYIEQSNSQKQKVEWWLTGAERREDWELFSGYNINRISVWEGGKFLEMGSGDGYKTM